MTTILNYSDDLNTKLTSSLFVNGWPVSADVICSTDKATKDYVAIELAGASRAKIAYEQRVRFLGLTELGMVLDFGCGIGQWAAVLSELNDRVVGVDKSLPRLRFARSLNASLNRSNVSFLTNETELVDGSFDAIICYSVFMFLDGPKYANFFSRLLKPGGKLYIMVDLPGWHIRTLFKRPLQLPFLGYIVIRTILGFKRNIAYTKQRLDAILNQADFDIVSQGADGEASFLLDKNQSLRVSPFLQNQFAGFQTLYEVCAIKRYS